MTPIVLLAAYASGIALVRSIAPGDITGHGLTIGILLLLWIALCRSRWGWLPFLALLLATGFLNASLQLKPPPTTQHISQFAESSPLILEGMVLTIEKRETGGYRLLAEMRQVIEKHGASAVYGRVLIYIKEGTMLAKPGQVIRWRSSLRRPYKFGNPGEFDYPLYLAARNIYVTAFVTHAEEIALLVNHPERQSKTLENLRYTLAAHIERAVPEETTGFVQSLLLGLRGAVSQEQRRLLADSGVAHLFAISGLHFGLLALLLYQIGKWLYTRSERLILWCPPQRLLPVLLILPLTAYLFLTGNAWATRRAFLMVSVAALLFARDRRTSPFALLASVGLCLLLFDPLALFQPGFQLSFAGVAGILIWLPGWLQPFANSSRLVRWPITLILTTTAATLATAPATLWHFHRFAPAGLLTNLIAIPLIAWGAVPVGLISMACLPFSTTLADFGLLLSAKLVMLAINAVTSICQWPGLAAVTIYLTTSKLLFLIGSLLILMPFGNKLRHWLYRLGIMLITLSITWITQPKIADFQVTSISVGQGDATLISLAGNVHYLVDGGGLPGSSIDPGEQLIAPALGRMGVHHLRGVILTHNHPDHSSGLVYILRHFPVEAFYLAEDIIKLPPDLQEVLQQRKVTVHPVRAGWTDLHKEASQSFGLFSPSQNARDINERSIAVFAGEGNEGVLLTADLGRTGFEQLLAAGIPGPTTLLKLPHHGSRHSQPEVFLEKTQPSTAFVSSGRGNQYGFPHQQTIEACATRQIPLFRTDLQGMLTFRIEDGQWHMHTGRAL